MNSYGELQQLKGVGRVTAKALAAAGFTNIQHPPTRAQIIRKVVEDLG